MPDIAHKDKPEEALDVKWVKIVTSGDADRNMKPSDLATIMGNVTGGGGLNDPSSIVGDGTATYALPAGITNPLIIVVNRLWHIRDATTDGFTISGSNFILSENAPVGATIHIFPDSPGVGDIIAPVYQSSEVGNVNSTTIVMSYDESLDGASTPANGDFALAGIASGATVISVLITGSEVRLTLSSAVVGTDSPTVSYTQGVNAIQDTSGNAAVNLTTEAVTNNLSYDPSAQSGIVVAILSDSALPLDVSGNSNHILQSSGHGAPTNASGLNEFNNADSDQTEFTTEVSIASSTPFTEIFEVAFNDLAPSESTTLFSQDTAGSSDWFGPNGPTATKLTVRVGATTDQTIVLADEFTTNIPRIVTIKRDASDICTIQFDDETPISLFAAAANTNARLKHFFGGANSFPTKHIDAQLGRFILFAEDKTGQDLVDAKQWVADGTP